MTHVSMIPDDFTRAGDIGMHVLPLMPIVSRGTLMLRFRSLMHRDLSEQERDTKGHKDHINGLTALAFSAVIAFLVLGAQEVLGSYLPTYYVMISFLSLMVARNVQDYKFTRGRDQMATALTEVGVISLLLALLVFLAASNLPALWILVFTIAVAVAWIADHIIRLRYQWEHLLSIKGGTDAE
jgi:hypothetical protein